MACRRLIGALGRHHVRPRLFAAASLESPHVLFLRSHAKHPAGECGPPPDLSFNFEGFRGVDTFRFGGQRRFSSRPTKSSDDDEEKDDDDEEDYEGEEDDEGEEEENLHDGEDDDASASKCVVQRGKSEEEKLKEASEIGYNVVGPLSSSENPFKPYEPAFAVVQIGSHQFKVSNGDSIFTERLKYCEVNDKLILNKVLMVGSKTQTIIGRPILPDVAVHAVVEEHALDAKVIIFKKKRRKNYRRTKGHRQELTKLRITDIQGIDKPESVAATA